MQTFDFPAPSTVRKSVMIELTGSDYWELFDIAHERKLTIEIVAEILVKAGLSEFQYSESAHKGNVTVNEDRKRAGLSPIKPAIGFFTDDQVPEGADKLPEIDHVTIPGNPIPGGVGTVSVMEMREGDEVPEGWEEIGRIKKKRTRKIISDELRETLRAELIDGKSVTDVSKKHVIPYQTIWNIKSQIEKSKPAEEPYIAKKTPIEWNSGNFKPDVSGDSDIIDCANPKCMRRRRFVKGTGMPSANGEFCTGRCWQDFKERTHEKKYQKLHHKYFG